MVGEKLENEMNKMKILINRTKINNCGSINSQMSKCHLEKAHQFLNKFFEAVFELKVSFPARNKLAAKF